MKLTRARIIITLYNTKSQKLLVEELCASMSVEKEEKRKERKTCKLLSFFHFLLFLHKLAQIFQ